MEDENSFENLFTLRTLILTNALDMLLYMLVIYWLCGSSHCVKEWSLILFAFQLMFNFALCGWLIHREQEDFRFLWINIFWLAALFLVFSLGQNYW